MNTKKSTPDSGCRDEDWRSDRARPWYERVKGFSREAVRQRFPHAPVSLTEEWLKDHLWWWRALSKGIHPLGFPEEWRYILGWMKRRGAMEEWLDARKTAEWAARVYGGAIPVLSFPPEGMAFVGRGRRRFTLGGITITELHSEAEVTKEVLAHLRHQGWKPGPGVFKRPSRNAGRKNWSTPFKAIELVDTWSLLGKEKGTFSDKELQSIKDQLRA